MIILIINTFAAVVAASLLATGAAGCKSQTTKGGEHAPITEG